MPDVVVGSFLVCYFVSLAQSVKCAPETSEPDVCPTTKVASAPALMHTVCNAADIASGSYPQFIVFQR